MRPARRAEDKVARIMSRAADGLYDGQQMAFSSGQSAVELAMATGRGICGVPDEWGRCAARFHSTGSQPAPEPQMQVYVTNGTRTSQGPGPGPKTLPASEANALIGMRFAVPGTRPPNEGDPEPATRRFGGPVSPPSTRQHSN
jgi:hypothetical protein